MPAGGVDSRVEGAGLELSVVVCSLGNGALTDAVKSIAVAGARAGREVEIVVVWQGGAPPPSFPGSVRVLEVFPVGLSHARNRGLAVARGELVGFVDDDELVDEEWVAAVLAAFAGERPPAGVFGPVLSMEAGEPPYFRPGRERVLFEARRTPPWLVGTGGNMVFRRETLARTGGFDPRFGIGGPARSAEETDLILRLLSEGHALVFAPEMLAYHPTKNEREQIRSRRLYAFGMGSVLRRSPVLAGKYLFTIGEELARAVGQKDARRRREVLATLRHFLAGLATPLRARSPGAALERLPADLHEALNGAEPRPLRASFQHSPHFRYALERDRLLHLYVAPSDDLRQSFAERRRHGDTRLLEVAEDGDALWALERRSP